MISIRFGSNPVGGIVRIEDCRSIISAAINRGNVELALSIFYSMRASFDLGGSEIDRWRWSRPDVEVYTMLVNGLAASLRVSDSLKIISDICRVGISPGEEVPFGKIVRCPNCLIAIAVAQPQNGVQIVSCANCRYQYELFSGDIISIESEELGSYTQQGDSSMGTKSLLLYILLSTETWDSILTEEERFLLSRFLPDMDQESFGLTMQELLGGVNLYFGSPVDKFFKKLRGGLFTPKVACCKEGVTFFKRKRYYYSLKFYHERMIKTFIEMQRLWDQYGRKDLSKNARLHLKQFMLYFQQLCWINNISNI